MAFLRKVFHFGSSLPKHVPKTIPSIFSWIKVDRAQDSFWAHFFGDLSQREKLSEIKPPLVKMPINMYVVFEELISLIFQPCI